MPVACPFDDFGNGGLVLGYALLEGEPHMEEEWRGEKERIAHRVECGLGGWRLRACRLAHHLVPRKNEPLEAIGMTLLPERAGGIEPYVAAGRLQLARVKGQLDVGRALEEHWRGTDGG